jgi:hypothetical protein
VGAGLVVVSFNKANRREMWLVLNRIPHWGGVLGQVGGVDNRLLDCNPLVSDSVSQPLNALAFTHQI